MLEVGLVNPEPHSYLLVLFFILLVLYVGLLKSFSALEMYWVLWKVNSFIILSIIAYLKSLRKVKTFQLGKKLNNKIF